MELHLKPIERNQRNAETGRFIEGMTPWNKWRKGVMPGKSSTMFRKGYQPLNTRKDGDISIRKETRSGKPYKYIRISKSKWVLLHRLTWEQHNGTIPRGHVIRFMDGNTLNCDISNLECLSKAENMNRNRNYKKLSETFKELWRREKLRLAVDLPPLSGFGRMLRR